MQIAEIEQQERFSESGQDFGTTLVHLHGTGTPEERGVALGIFNEILALISGRKERSSSRSIAGMRRPVFNSLTNRWTMQFSRISPDNIIAVALLLQDRGYTVQPTATQPSGPRRM